MVRFRYCPKLMFYYLWLKFSLLILIFIVFLISYIYLNFYLNILKIETILYWKIFYLIFSFFSLIIVIYIYSDEIIYNFILKINETIIIKDPQDYINLNIDLIFFYLFIFITPLIFFFIWIYMLNFWHKKDIILWNIINIYLIYLFFILKWIVDEDLFLSNWNYFYTNKLLFYDIQPDISLIYLSYIGEYTDLCIYLYFNFIYQIVLYLLIFNFWAFNKILYNWLRLILNIILFLLAIYFFGGETFLRLLFLLVLFFITQEFYFFLLLFFSTIKLKKL